MCDGILQNNYLVILFDLCIKFASEWSTVVM
jgi:hypothetical protein